MLTTRNNQISVTELKRLLHAIKDSRPDICLRFRLAGEMWQNSHLKLLDVSEKGVVLNDAHLNKLIYIRDLNKVMQFELDEAFQQYQPHFHYSVKPI